MLYNNVRTCSWGFKYTHGHAYVGHAYVGHAYVGHAYVEVWMHARAIEIDLANFLAIQRGQTSNNFGF